MAEVEQLKNKNNTPMMRDGHIPTVYLGSKSMPLKTTVILPSVFYEIKRYQYPGQKFSLDRAVSMIVAETGVLIRVSQDVYDNAAQPTATTLNTTVEGVRPSLPTGRISLSHSKDGIVLNADKSLIGILDSICTQMGLNWEYRNGVVVIQRLVTRTFQLKVQAGTRQFDTSNAKSGSTQATTGSTTSGGISSGLSSSATVTTSSGKVAAIDTVVESLRAVLSPVGKAIPNAATGTITVIDNIDGVERAEKIMNRENELLNRFSKIRIEIYTFDQNDQDESGIDWNVAFQNLSKFGAIVKSPTTITNNLGGTVTLSVLKTDTVGKFDGTSAFLNLLNENGKAHTVYDQVVQARNRVATAASATIQKVYLAETTPAPASSTGAVGGVVGLTPGTITTGLDLQLQPNIYDSGQMSLLFSLGLLDLVDIQTITSGSGDNQSSIQSPETKGYSFQQDVPLRVGETTFIAGYEATLNSYTRRALNRDAPLLAGGSFKGNGATQKLFIFITPISIGTTY
jgi:type IVB pilus formation R64 PilN family outer membrane protein